MAPESRPIDVAVFGRGLEHMDDVAADLRDRVETMAAILRIYAEEGEPTDIARLEIPAETPDTELADAARDVADAFALDVDVARWEGDDSEIARVRFLLAFGGPNVWLDVSYHGDAPDRVTLARFWGGDRDRAETEDPRALDVVDSFVRAFFVID